jgi:hypothetical protein
MQLLNVQTVTAHSTNFSGTVTKEVFSKYIADTLWPWSPKFKSAIMGNTEKTSLCVCVCVYIYIYIYTHTHTHIRCNKWKKVFNEKLNNEVQWQWIEWSVLTEEKFPITSELITTKHLPLLWYKPSVNAVSVIHWVKRFSGKIYHMLTQNGEKRKMTLWREHRRDS